MPEGQGRSRVCTVRDDGFEVAGQQGQFVGSVAEVVLVIIGQSLTARQLCASERQF
jgi:hypothetical protein